MSLWALILLYLLFQLLLKFSVTFPVSPDDQCLPDYHGRHSLSHGIYVKEWYLSQGLLYYLPSYYPELNPDEFLNQDVKSHLRKQRLQTKSQMVKMLISYLKMRQKQPQIIQSFAKGCHTQYAA